MHKVRKKSQKMNFAAPYVKDITAEILNVRGANDMGNNYYKNVLYPFVENLIRDNKKITSSGEYELSVNDLLDHDLYLFAMHLLEHHDRDLYSIYENEQYDDIVKSLFDLLKSGDVDSKIEFADKIRHNIVEYYKPKMQKMIDNAIGWVEQEDYLISVVDKVIHKDNGEIEWIKK